MQADTKRVKMSKTHTLKGWVVKDQFNVPYFYKIKYIDEESKMHLIISDLSENRVVVCV